MIDHPLSKTELRHQLRERRQSLDAARQASAAEAAARHLASLPGWLQSRRVALYLAADGELNPQAIATRCRERGQALYLPVITPKLQLEFALWHEQQTLTINRFGIPEPPVDAPRCPVAGLDLVFLPLVGWSKDGSRLGMGGGYYDRSLAQQSGPLLVGLAHSCQEAAGLPQDSWDIKLDFIVTERELHRCEDARGEA